MTDHLNLKLLIFVGILQVLRFDFKKFRILEIFNFHQCTFERDTEISLRLIWIFFHAVCLCLFGRQLWFEILEHLPKDTEAV